MPPKATPQSFLAKIAKGNHNDCWPWTGKAKIDGYGSTIFHGRPMLAHRLAYKLWVRDPGELCVLHKCDNRACCNPSHLFLGTRGDNNHDRHKKGRSRGGSLVGEANPMFGKRRDEVRRNAALRRSENANARAAERLR